MSFAVAALIELSKFRLSTIANQLVSVLENVSKVSIAENPDGLSSNPVSIYSHIFLSSLQSSSLSIDDYVPYDVLQSQLFLLRMLSACMQHHWKSCRESASELEDPDDLGLDNDARSLSSNEDNGSENGQDQSNGLPPVLEDPPALDEPLAKYIVNVLMRFIHQMASVDDKAFAHYSNNTPGIARSEQHYFPSNTNSSTGIIIDIYKAACRVIFYTSASNWNVVFAKVKARIMYLTTTSEEYPETSDLRLLECSALDSKRLTMVLTSMYSWFFCS
jgi:neurofibromin 1